ncbi:hypothetical protein HBI56_022130 [Parastagonospora nodorum]|uniref:Uncharacterized protein n=1 Tax=Phaeosphaeria nodorum (strain SN15 / ATCC MYA-4574 / FGSC 10173) TaxID=321614 RepID=A0A7U2HZN5_PHANO|nr:hypothetical protein HBH56_175120 [Parastagonospora nodorum]QRC96299.1 hypothetical protein JI435_408640 [Parastagonospora nodorum SN15]KAH3926481.1 hypothetical protein HBH54_168050 [Parastagonospora nodorum]KAH3955493.1 hypothetical protein HBH53_000870 [Parastagonospora nodorum]KAH3965706.1 hypothetical protein HBH52_204710 [Parastagonospora nodorum]
MDAPRTRLGTETKKERTEMKKVGSGPPRGAQNNPHRRRQERICIRSAIARSKEGLQNALHDVENVD